MTQTTNNKKPNGLWARMKGWVTFGGRQKSSSNLRESIEELIENQEPDQPSIDPDERLLLKNTLHLRELTAEDVMVPRADIVSIPVDTNFEDLVKLVRERGHSRYPVYRGNLDDTLGMVHIKDILSRSLDTQPFELRSLMRKLLFVAPAMRALDLLLQMRFARVHMALVVDEYGGVDGLITIEDLVEEIVGEIRDEHATDALPQIIDYPDHTLIADGRVAIDVFEAKVGIPLKDPERDGDVDTLGGLVSSLAGCVPAHGEIVTHPSGIEFEVLDVDPRRVKKIRVRNYQTAKVVKTEGA